MDAVWPFHGDPLAFADVDDSTPTIYEWAGGRDAFARWMDRFYDLIESQAPDIAVLFGGKVSEQHRAHVTDWWAEVMGGPAAYTETRGGYEHMLARHRDLTITPRAASFCSGAVDEPEKR
jgi:truncated hemoglobin YjbI